MCVLSQLIGEEEDVSVYDIADHPDFRFRTTDFVIRIGNAEDGFLVRENEVGRAWVCGLMLPRERGEKPSGLLMLLQLQPLAVSKEIDFLSNQLKAMTFLICLCTSWPISLDQVLYLRILYLSYKGLKESSLPAYL